MNPRPASAKGGLSGGSIAGLVVGVAALLAIIAVGFWMLRRSSEKRKHFSTAESTPVDLRRREATPSLDSIELGVLSRPAHAPSTISSESGPVVTQSAMLKSAASEPPTSKFPASESSSTQSEPEKRVSDDVKSKKSDSNQPRFSQIGKAL